MRAQPLAQRAVVFPAKGTPNCNATRAGVPHEGQVNATRAALRAAKWPDVCIYQRKVNTAKVHRGAPELFATRAGAPRASQRKNASRAA